jgi:hypothetical protein
MSKGYRRLLHRNTGIAGFFSQLLEQFVFQRIGPFFGGQDFFFVFLEFRRNVPLGVLDRLFANVLRRNLFSMDIGDLNVIAEDIIERDLERNARPLRFVCLILRNPVFAAASQDTQFVEFGIETATDESAFPIRQRTLINLRGFQRRAKFGTRINVRPQCLDKLARKRFEYFPKERQHPKRFGNERQVPWLGSIMENFCLEPLQIVNPTEIFPKIADNSIVLKKFLNGIKTEIDLRNVGQRTGDPLTEEPGPHWRNAAVQYGKERTVAAAFSDRSSEFEASTTCLVDFQLATGPMRRDGIDLGQPQFLRFLEKFENRSGGADCGHIALGVRKAESFERCRAEVFE